MKKVQMSQKIDKQSSISKRIQIISNFNKIGKFLLFCFRSHNAIHNSFFNFLFADNLQEIAILHDSRVSLAVGTRGKSQALPFSYRLVFREEMQILEDKSFSLQTQLTLNSIGWFLLCSNKNNLFIKISERFGCQVLIYYINQLLYQSSLVQSSVSAES